jgi:hypothetical protein
MPGRYSYEVGRFIDAKSYDFYALIQAALRRADSVNYAKLAAVFPAEAEELEARYNAPGGELPNDPPYYGPTAADMLASSQQ